MMRHIVTSLLLLALVVPAAGGNEPFFADGPASGARAQTIGPGKVHLLLSENGRWAGLASSWSERSLLSDGGVLVFADDPDGKPKHVTMFAPHDYAGDQPGPESRIYHEGIEGGARAPAMRPDDDGDGRIDEDRLDRIDNDGDGLVDEDYAAIGDEMIVSRYVGDELASGARLEIHQEAYAWSLPHLDGTILLRVWIKNTGVASANGVRVAAYLRTSEPLSYSEHTIGPEGTSGLEARMVACTGDGGANVELVALPSDPAGAWQTGFATSDVDIATQIENRIRTEDALVIRSPVVTVTPAILPQADAEDIPLDPDAGVYVFSPTTPTLAPGEEFSITFGLAAVSSQNEVLPTGDMMLRTYVGDGEHAFVPPPVSVTPRVLWGNFHPLADGEPGVFIEIESNGIDTVGPERFSYFSGITPGSVSRGEGSAGHEGLVLRGESVEEHFKKAERVTLKGRLDSGEFFELILRPEQDYLAATQEAEHYWQTPEKLGQDLLLSSPNPFRNSTTITYEIPSVVEEEDGSQIEFNGSLETSVKVYNVMGRLVSVLVDEEFASPGVYTTQWQAVDDSGNTVASGVYYIKLQIGQKYMTKRVILLK